jgi:hypothetical protein
LRTKSERGGEKPMRRRILSPFDLQSQEAGHGELIERLVPTPAEVGDDARDQGVEIDFPGSGDASRVAFCVGCKPAALATEGKTWISSPTEK